MKNKKMLVNIISAILLVSLCAISFFLFKPPAKTQTSENTFEISDFQSLKIYSSEDFNLGDFKRISFKTEEPEIQKFISGFIYFLDDYEFDPDSKNPDFHNYFTNIEYNVSLFDDNYSHELFQRSLDLIQRFVYTDWWEGAEVKTKKIREIKILSKTEKEIVDMLPNPVDKYVIGVIAEVERGSMFDPNVKRFDDLRLLEFTVVKEENKYKIHDINVITDLKQIESFLGKFGDNQSLTLDNLIKDLETGSGDAYNSSNKINKYTPSGSAELPLNISFDKVKSLEDSFIQSIAKNTNDKILVLTNCDESGKVKAIGTGFFVKPGIIATNCHVIAGAKKLDIITHKGKKLELEGIIAANGVLDLALLKLKDEVGEPVKLGAVDEVKREDALIAIGHPLGVTYSVSTGVFDTTTKNQDVLFMKNKLPLAPGNSGGPLINTKGEVVGINTAINQFGDISYAIPVSYLDPVLNSLSKYKFSDIKSVKIN